MNAMHSRSPSQQLQPAIRAWMLSAWDAVDWQFPGDETASASSGWQHHTSTVTYNNDTGLYGESVWILHAPNGTAGIAFEWLEWRPGVVVLRDPMSLVSNIAITQGCWAHLPRTLVNNYLANAIPWQVPALEAIDREFQRSQPRFPGPSRTQQSHHYRTLA